MDTGYAIDTGVAEGGLQSVNEDFSSDPQTSNGECRIAGIEYPILNDNVNELNLARFQNKTTFGDYSFDSDPLISAQVFSSFTGGMGNETLKEGVDDDTFWEADLETRFPDGATLLPLTESFGGSLGTNNAAFPIGDFPAEAPLFLAAFDNKVEKWSPDDREFSPFATLTANPVEEGIEFEDLLYVPLGANGYDTITSSGTVTNVPDTHVIQFVLYDLSLAALTVEGYLLIMPPGGSFPSPSADMKLPKGHTPRKMVNFINSRGEPTLHLVTNKSVYAYDPDGVTLYQTRLDYPKHPDQGLGAVNWRGDSMFVSVGLGIHGYNGSIIQSMGPDGRHGLPARHRGRIVDLEGEYNALLALVRGIGAPTSTEEASEEYIIQTPMYQDQNSWAISSFPFEPVYSTILRWSNTQWHKVWESPDASGVPTRMHVSEAEGEYRLWWGYGKDMYTQTLPRAFQNPKQYLRSGEQLFMPTGRLITGWFDADMTAFDKLSTHVEVLLHDVNGLGDAGGTVTFEYQYDNTPAWFMLGTADTIGLTILPFQNVVRDAGNPFSRGLAWNRIRFRISYEQKQVDDGEGNLVYVRNMSPLMLSAVSKFIKVPNSQLSWSFTIPLSQPGGYKGRDNKFLAEHLDKLLTSREMFEFGYQDKVYRVRMAQVTGDKRSGYNDHGNYTANLVEVRLGSERRNAVTKYVDMVQSG
jgi:hypothetical protein